MQNQESLGSIHDLLPVFLSRAHARSKAALALLAGSTLNVLLWAQMTGTWLAVAGCWEEMLES